MVCCFTLLAAWLLEEAEKYRSLKTAKLPHLGGKWSFAWSTHKVASVLRTAKSFSLKTPPRFLNTQEKREEGTGCGRVRQKGVRVEERVWQTGWLCLAGLHAQLLPGGRLLGLRLGAGIRSAIESRHSAAFGVGVQAAVWWVAGLQLRDPLGLL